MTFDPRYAPIPEDMAAGSPAGEKVSAFMVQCLFRSLAEGDVERPSALDDADVQIYLAFLLTRLLDPAYHRRVAGLVARYDSDVSSFVGEATTPRWKYDVYRANADHLLTMLGVFGGFGGRGHRPADFGATDDLFVGRGKAYYDFASVYSESLPDGARGVTDVLRKLSTGFETYLALLRHTRTEYFHLLETLGAGSWFHLERSADDFAKEEEVGRLHDRLLDLLLVARRRPSPETAAEIRAIVARIREHHPGFTMPGGELGS